MVERTLITLPSQLQLIERLQHLIYLSSSLTFVSGEAGSGKTTLIENLSNALPGDLQQVYISLVNEQTENALRQKIVAQFYNKALFNAEDKLLDTIFRLQQSEQQTKKKLIIIDNAQYLPAGFIIELCELFSEPNFTQDNNFNILLLTDEKTTKDYIHYIDTHLVSRLQSTLNHLELTLPALDGQEANELLLHNFQQIGYQAKLQHQDALNRQLALCNGNPQKIIALAEGLNQGLLETVPPSWVKTKLPAVLLMLILVIIVSLLAAYLYPKFVPNSTKIDESDNDLLTEGTITGVAPTESIKQESLASSWATLDLEVENNQSMVGLSDKTEQRTVISDNQLLELTVLSDTSNNDIPNPLANKNTDQYQVPLLLQLPVVINDDIISEDDSFSESELINTKQKVTTIADSDNGATSDSNDEEVLSVADELLTNVSSSVVKKDKPLISTEKEDSLLTASYILLSKKPNNFTVQISGMASRRYLAIFQQKYESNTENVFSYKTIRNNKPWFVVIYGEYSSVESANLAIKSLPEAFKGRPTWIKTWQAVHNDLRLNNE